LLETLDASLPKVLIVDDVESNIMILEEILKDDYEILTAKNGKDALKVLQSAKELPRIILLDLQMPEMNGRELFDVIKKDANFKRIPVIFVTSENDSESELLAAGANEFIRKGAMPDIVKLRVSKEIAYKNYSDHMEVLVAEKSAEVIQKTKELNASQESLLHGLANVIEHRDLESGQHVKRTQLYVYALATHLVQSNSVYARELVKLQPETIMKSMPLHDVGKIAIRDSILLKPGPLTPEEYEIMKTHTIRGKEIIEDLGDINSSLYLRHCRDICVGHHERWDGNGYPYGLKGDEIPVTARLASLADVYDALVSSRVYKKTFSHDKSLSIIQQGKGTQFDAVMTEALLDIEGEFQKIAELYA